MQFTDNELKIIYAVFKINIDALEYKKGHKSKNDILALNHMKKINIKIDKYIDSK